MTNVWINQAMDYSAQAAVTKYHKLFGLNKNLFSHGSEG